MSTLIARDRDNVHLTSVSTLAVLSNSQQCRTTSHSFREEAPEWRFESARVDGPRNSGRAFTCPYHFPWPVGGHHVPATVVHAALPFHYLLIHFAIRQDRGTRAYPGLASRSDLPFGTRDPLFVTLTPPGRPREGDLLHRELIPSSFDRFFVSASSSVGDLQKTLAGFF